jgi:hypothetical protein
MAKVESKSWINNPWVITLIAYLVLSPIGSWIYDHTKNIPVLSPILKISSFIWNEIFNFKIAVWAILLIVFIGRFCIIFLKRLNKESPKSDAALTLPFMNYTSDRFKKWKWSWKYHVNSYSNTFIVENLSPVCDVCNIKTSKSWSDGYYHCPMCRKEYISDYSGEYEYDIHALINHHIEVNNLNKPVIQQ